MKSTESTEQNESKTKIKNVKYRIINDKMEWVDKLNMNTA